MIKGTGRATVAAAGGSQHQRRSSNHPELRLMETRCEILNRIAESCSKNKKPQKSAVGEGHGCVLAGNRDFQT